MNGQCANGLFVVCECDHRFSRCKIPEPGYDVLAQREEQGWDAVTNRTVESMLPVMTWGSES